MKKYLCYCGEPLTCQYTIDHVPRSIKKHERGYVVRCESVNCVSEPDITGICKTPEEAWKYASEHENVFVED